MLEIKITTAVDTEYVQKIDQPNQIITTQVALSESKSYIYEHPTLGDDILPTWKPNTRCILSTILECEEVTLKEGEKPDGEILWEVLMFYAPADLLAGLFNDLELCRYIQRYCRQDRRIRLETEDKKNPDQLKLDIYLKLPDGIFQVILKVKDFGKVSVGSLEKIVTAFGLKMPEKSLMDEYKTNMLIPYRDPDLLEDYIKYAQRDAEILFTLREANQKRMEALFKIHDLSTPNKEILTTGSLVAKLFETYLNRYIGDNKAYKFFTKRKWSKTKKYGLQDLLRHSTVKEFAKKDQSSEQANALVQGGRAKNERPNMINVKGAIADIDLSSCYVNILKELIYPIGLPSTYGQHRSCNKKISLEKFLKKNGEELERNLFVITVAGELNHHQTLVPSKVIDNLEIIKKYREDNPKIPADFRLYTKEVINGIITSDVLDVINNVCSRKERKSWMELEVVSAIWYPKSKRCHTPKEWYQKMEAHVEREGNSVETNVSPDGKKVTKDKRSRYWLAVPIKDFLTPYADLRQELKDEMKTHPKDSDRYNELNAQQNAMKLVGNTLYGVLASPYFDIGNVCIANNITAAARVAVWSTAMAGGSFQSITDGGAYNLNEVRDWKDKKPTMNTLALWRNPKLLNRCITRNLLTKPLASRSKWVIAPPETKNEYSIVSNSEEEKIEGKEGVWSFFDEAFLAHVKHFFRDGGGDLQILDKILYEHKDMYTEIVIQSQTNYQFHHVNGDKKNKARGHKVKGTPYKDDTEASNILRLFEDLRKTPNAIPPYTPQTIAQLLKCNQANEMLASKTDNILKQNNLLAGDTITKRAWVRPVSLSMFHWQTDRQYQSWHRKCHSIKNKTGWGVEQFFINDDGTVDYLKAIETIQKRIDEGSFWLIDGDDDGDGLRYDKMKSHPFMPAEN